MNKKYSPLLSLFFFILYVYTCESTHYAAIGEGGGLIVSFIPVIISIVVALIFKISFFTRPFSLIMGVFVLWNVVLTATTGRFPSPYPFITIFVAYVAFHAYKKDFMDRFISLTVKLGLLNLLIWMLCLVAPGAMESFGASCGIESQNVSYSFFVFNIPIFHDGVTFARNCGNCWEAGRYSCVIMIAIYCYLLKNGIKWRSFSFIILVLSLLTTFSTTGYIILLATIAIWVLYNKKFNPLYLMPVVLVIIGVWSLPFMRDKVMGGLATEDSAMSYVDGLVYHARHGNENYYTPQRIEAFLLQLMNLVNMPLLTGEGRNLMFHYLNRTYDIHLALSEGVLGVLVRYGLVLGVLCYVSLYKTSLYFSQFNKHCPRILFFVIFILENVSYYLWEAPLFALMWCWYFYSKDINSVTIKKKI